MLYHFSGFSLDPVHKKLFYKDQIISEDDRIIGFIAQLCGNWPDIADKNQLLETLWPGQIVTEASLSRLVSDTRSLLKEAMPDQDLIKTVRGKGFRLNSPVEQSTNDQHKESVTPQQPTKPAKSRLIIAAMFISVTLIMLISFVFVNTQKERAKNPLQNIRIALLPVENNTGEPRYAWVKYGVLSIAAQQLASYPGIQVIPVESMISLPAEQTSLQNDPQQLFSSTCNPLGCNRLIKLSLNLSQQQRPQLTYQIISDDYLSPESRFEQGTVLESADMMLDHLVSELLPAQSEKILLRETYSDNPKTNRDFAIAVHELMSGDLKRARAYLNIALQDNPDFFWARAYLTELEYRNGAYELAHKQLKDLFKTTRKADQVFYLKNIESNIFYSQGDLEASLNLSKQLAENPHAQKHPLLQAQQWMNSGSTLQALGQLDEAEHFLKLAIDGFKNNGYQAQLGSALFNLANVYLVQQQDQLAIQHYQQALEIFVRFRRDNFARWARQAIAGARINIGEYVQAENDLLRLIPDYQQAQDSESVFTVHLDLVNLSLAKQDYDEARARLDEINPELQESEFSYQKNHALLLSAYTDYKLGLFQKAQQQLDERSGEWSDPRPKFLMLPVSLQIALGHTQQAKALAEQIKSDNQSIWTDKHAQLYQQIISEL